MPNADTTPLRRKDDVAENADGMPWYVKAVGIIGVPSAIALYLVISLVSWGNAMMAQGNVGKEIQAQLATHITQMMTMAAEQSTIRDQNEVIIRVLRTSCVNASKTNEDRAQCLR